MAPSAPESAMVLFCWENSKLEGRSHRTARLPKRFPRAKGREKNKLDEYPWIYFSVLNNPLFTYTFLRDTAPAAPLFPQLPGDYKSEFGFYPLSRILTTF